MPICPSKKMKDRICSGSYTLRILFAFAGIFAGHLLFTASSMAQECIPSWPTLSDKWFIGPDNYYTSGNTFGYSDFGELTETCNACECSPVDASGFLYIDGAPTVCGGNVPFPVSRPNTMAEGPHTAFFSVTARNLSNWQEQTVNSEYKAFYVDNTPPTISLTKPEANAVLSPADLVVAGSIKDDASKVGWARVSISAFGSCRFHKDLFGTPGTYETIGGVYCSAWQYDLDPNQVSHFCNANIGTAGDYAVDYNLSGMLDSTQQQDCQVSFRIDGVDRVANSAEAKTVNFKVDFAPPVVSITSPAADADMYTDMQWGDPNLPVITGTAADLSDITDVWLTIKDEKGERWWNGVAWQGGMATVNATEKTGTNPVAWKYTGFTRDAMRSGTFMITAYAKDKFGHVGAGYRRAGYRRHYFLGEKNFTGYQISMKDVRNNSRAESENPYSFTTKIGEYAIDVTAELTPAWLGPILNRYVKWTVSGVNNYVSGTPNQPHEGNPSVFYVSPPQVPTRPAGRADRMGYEVTSRVEFMDTVYGNPGKLGIYQDEIDKCRQEYIDLKKEYLPTRNLFQLPPSPYYGGNCGAYIMLPATIDAYNAIKVDFHVRITSTYRNPIYNKYVIKSVAPESPHMYGLGMDLAPNLINCNDVNARALRAEQMELLFDSAPSPKMLERAKKSLDPFSTVYNDYDILDVYDACSPSGADHVHIGSGNY